MLRYLIALYLAFSTHAFAQELMQPVSTADLQYAQKLLTGDYDPDIPHPDQVLGFPVGQRTATPAQIVEVISTISDASERVQLIEYARTHEGRPLYYLVISSPQNLARTAVVKADLARLADPRELNPAQANAIIDQLPAVAWMAYSIHGNESSGSDAAITALYHLAADRTESTRELLDKMIVIIDPSQNPDGRARFVKGLEQVRAATPNVDTQSLLHSEFWPYGRGNHYYFDLNRDFIYGTQPETRGKVAAINSWYPQLVVDVHEMGAHMNYHFSPSREPINFHISDRLVHWNRVFGKDQGAAFDKQAWSWYNGEEFDDLYPGYTTYSQYRGAINILYEQAGFAEDGVRQDNRRIETYRSAVHRQLTSTLANLDTLVRHSKAIYQDFVMDRRDVLDSGSPYANQTFVIFPTKNHSRLRTLVNSLEMQGVEMYRASQDLPVRNALDQMGHIHSKATVPAGSLIIPNRQPEGRLLATLMEFEADIRDENLRKERESLLRGQGGIMYDVTAWNLSMLYGLEAWIVPSHLQTHLQPYSTPSEGAQKLEEGALGYLVEGEDDHATSFAARAMEAQIRVRVLTSPTEFDGEPVSRGSILVSRNDNPELDGKLGAAVSALSDALKLSVRSFDSGHGPGDLPDIGGRYLPLLEAPRLAIVSREGVSTTDYGAIWYTVDRYLGIRHSHLDSVNLDSFDLRRYNVIVLPDMRASALSSGARDNLNAWVEGGGTLVAVRGAAAAIADPETGLSQVRAIGDSFDEIDSYDLQLQREWQARNPDPDLQLTRSQVAPADVDYPWQSTNGSGSKNQKAELEKRDSWQRLFMPQGAVLAGRTDQKHWLSMGSGKILPLFYSRASVLMAAEGVQAPVRLGEYETMDSARWKKLESRLDEEEKPWAVGWSTLPNGHELRLRMSGLLWPEAAQRIANSAYLTREAKGKGQIILFADRPSFRGATLGTNRLLLNAIVYGPGLGTQNNIMP